MGYLDLERQLAEAQASAADQARREIAEIASGHTPNVEQRIFDPITVLHAFKGELWTERDALKVKLAEAQAALVGFGGECATCGLRYWEHRGHIIPCPLCERVALKAAPEQARDLAYRACKEAVYAVFQEADSAGLYVSLDDVMSGLAKAYKVAALDVGKEAGK